LVLELLDHISKIICQTYLGQHGMKYSFKMAWDRERGMRLTCVTCTGVAPGGKQKVTLTFPDLYLDSGWLLTSACNFTLELASVFACLVANIEHLFAWDNKKGMFRIAAGTFNWTFRSVPLPSAELDEHNKLIIVKQLYLRGFFEGDDGLGRISRLVSGPKLQEHMVHSMADLGFSAKFKLVQDGRAEFIGSHSLAIDGHTRVDYPTVPDIKRYVGKIGVHAQARGDLSPLERVACAKARAKSLAQMFCGKIEGLYSVFKTQSELNWGYSDEDLKDTRVLIDSLYDPVAYGSGLAPGYHTYGEIAAALPPPTVKAFPRAAVQNTLICNSLEIPERPLIGEIEMFAQECLAQFRNGRLDHEAAYSSLPVEFQ
jgi:hypothetical protein